MVLQHAVLAVSHTGSKAWIKEIIAFLDRHRGVKAFLWSTPLCELGFYKCNGYKPGHRGGNQPLILSSEHRAEVHLRCKAREGEGADPVEGESDLVADEPKMPKTNSVND